MNTKGSSKGNPGSSIKCTNSLLTKFSSKSNNMLEKLGGRKPIELENDYFRTIMGVVIYKAFCLDVAQGHTNGAPNETRTHSWRFASLACYILHHLRRPRSMMWVFRMSHIKMDDIKSDLEIRPFQKNNNKKPSDIIKKKRLKGIVRMVHSDKACNV